MDLSLDAHQNANVSFGSGFPKHFFFFALSLSIRLLYLVLVVPLDWIGDSYHHWQIAWYTLNLGLPRGRMWDLKGCEYYWPPLPSLFEAFLMWIFRSPSLILMRFANIVFSSVSVSICYLIGRKYAEGVGEALAIAVLFFPYTLNYDVLALHEPMMILFALTAVLFYFRGNNFLAGLFTGLSYLCHFTSYLLAPLFILIYLVFHRSTSRASAFLSGFSLTYLPYALMLFFHTGDPIYNIRFLIVFSILGSTAEMRSSYALVIGAALLVAAISTLIISIRRYRRLIPISVIFSGYSLFWGLLIIFIGSPFSPYEMRYYWLLFMMAFLILSIVLNNSPLFKSHFKIKKLKLRASVIVVFLFSFIFLISSIPKFSAPQKSIQFSFQVADRIFEHYNSGTIISPLPDVTYRLTSKWRIPPQNILGPIYCPIDPTEKMEWIKRHQITLLLWVPGYEMDRVFPELKEGEDMTPFYLIEDFGHMLLYRVIF